MLREAQNIVCISTIDWDFIWQGHQEIMSALARQGHRVLFIENTGVRSVTLRDVPRLRTRLRNWRRGVRGIRKVMDNLYVYAPLVLPFPYSRAARAINRAVMFWTLRSWTKAMHFANPIVWTWLPTPLALELIEFLDGQLVVYYCCGDLRTSSSGSRRIGESEEALLRKADLVFAHSKAVFDRCSRITDQVHVVQYGFNREVFARADDRPPEELKRLKRPILGYVGGIHGAVDFDLLEKVALAHQDKSLVLIGPLQVDVGRLAGLPNVHFLGRKAYEELPTYIRHFDLALIPYVLNEYTQTVYPNKLNEYLIMGKPVLSTRLPEVEYFNRCSKGIVCIADNHDDFVARVKSELERDSDTLRAARVDKVKDNAWDEKITLMTTLIQGKLAEKAKTRELDWLVTFKSFYHRSRRRIAVSTATVLLAYSLVFHSPFVWMLAEPLKVAQEPAKADVIVILAGGIGESGTPGEAYREKVKRGVDLYRRGYSRHLLLSSGASYVFNETYVMKALAVSLGVPESDIIVDIQEGGNYTSLMRAKKIMDSFGWSSMLLVTSHYNGLRSHLVAKGNFPRITVTISPSNDSAFFGDRSKIEIKHLRAFGHEYLAILYYWLKGYV